MKKVKKSSLINLGSKSDEVSMEKGIYDITDSPMAYSKKKGKKKVWSEYASWMDRGLGPKGIKMKDVPGWNKIKGFNEWKDHKINEDLIPKWIKDKIPDWLKDMIPELPKFPTKIEEVPEFLLSLLKLAATKMFPIGAIIYQIYKRFYSKENLEKIKLRFIFPLQDWEVTAVDLVKKMGIVTALFKDTTSAINEAKELSAQRIKADEIVIGSHGSVEHEKTLGLLTTIEVRKGQENESKSNDYHLKNLYAFLDALKPMIKPSTTIFFTACGGADSLVNLVKVATRLNHTITAASGIYNYVTNTATKGYYSCRVPTNQDYERIRKKYPTLAQRKRYQIYPEEMLTDEILLEFGICTKLNSSPISWVEPKIVRM